MQGLVDGVAAKKIDIAVAALTVTAAREAMMDFTAPFFAMGLGIAVAVGGITNWAPVIWALNQGFRFTIQLLDVSFDPQHYAFALPQNSSLRKPVNIAILKSVQSSWWDDILYRDLNSR